MRHTHIFWRTLIALTGAFAIVWAWRLAVVAAWQWSQPAGGPTEAWAAQARVWLEWRTMWVPATLIATWGGYWIGGAAWLVWWLFCLRLAWGLSAGLLATATEASVTQVPAGDLPAAWLLALMPVAGGLLGSIMGRRALAPPNGSDAPPPLGPTPLPDEPPPAAPSRGRDFRKRDACR